ncbi:MAG: class I SAM-dependent methyltransferase [Lentisphaeria bacterium]|nr:class I SAM-dependent methyltransferase [Lentisphaeria bacterium]
MDSKKAERIRAHYERRVDSARPNYDILDWGSVEAQAARFEALLRAMVHSPTLPTCPTLLDIGCGMTDLADFLRDADHSVRYVGVDLTFGVIAEAARRTSGRLLLQADVFTQPPFPDSSFDVTYCSGVFNLKLGNNEAFALRALPRMLDYSRSLAVANFLHVRTPIKYPHCHYFDPDRIAAVMEREQGLRVEILDDYLENDFTIVLRR